MTKTLVPILAIAVAGSGVFGVIQKNRADALQNDVAALKSAIAQHEADARKLQAGKDKEEELLADVERLKRERDEANARAKAVASADEAGSGAKPALAAGTQAADTWKILQTFAKQLDHPDWRKSMKAEQQRQIASTYEAIFKKLGLSAEESDLVAEMLAQRNFSTMDQGSKLLTGKADEASMQAVRKEITGKQAETDAKLAGMLGKEKFKELTEFEHTLQDQRTLDGMARSFSVKSVPLNPQQKMDLLNIMREERLKNPTSASPETGGGSGMFVLLSDQEAKARQQQEEAYQMQVMNRAAAQGLFPDQVTVLKESFAERNQRQKTRRDMGRAILGGVAPR